MKNFSKIMIAVLLMFTMTLSYAQAPQAFVYQSTLSDTSGTPLSNQNVTLKISIIPGFSGGAAIYSEIHSVTTSLNGYINVNVGQGVPDFGLFSDIYWGEDLHFMKVELDPNGGFSFTTMGVTQLLSVPYAINAGTVSNTKYGFAASFTDSATAVSAGTIIFPTVAFNDGNGYNPLDGVYLVPADGVYMVNVYGLPMNISGTSYISVKVNGVDVDIDSAPSTQYRYSMPLKLNAGDGVEISITSSDTMLKRSSFSIVKVY